MATYKVSARHKKSTVETEYFVHKDDPNKRFHKELGWRWGSFYVDLTPEELAEIDADDEGSEFCPYDYENTELIECMDGCWEDWTFSDDIDEEEQQRIQEAYEEDYEDGLAELGYMWADSETVLVGPLDIELVEEDNDAVESDPAAPLDPNSWPNT